jgi:hypothetical protein
VPEEESTRQVNVELLPPPCSAWSMSMTSSSMRLVAREALVAAQDVQDRLGHAVALARGRDNEHGGCLRGLVGLEWAMAATRGQRPRSDSATSTSCSGEVSSGWSSKA